MRQSGVRSRLNQRVEENRFGSGAHQGDQQLVGDLPLGQAGMHDGEHCVERRLGDLDRTPQRRDFVRVLDHPQSAGQRIRVAQQSARRGFFQQAQFQQAQS